MNIIYKKFLPSVMRNTRWGDLITVFQNVIADLKSEKIDVLKNKFNIDTMTKDEILEEAAFNGYHLLSYNGYSSTNDYLNKQILTIVPRIYCKNTRTGYKYIYYIYNLEGDIFPVLLNTSEILQVLDSYWVTTELLKVANYTLDPVVPDTLDSVTGNWISYLDQLTSGANNYTRNLLLSFAPKFVETADEFISLNTLACLFNDVQQMKRSTEIPYFEYILNIPAYANKLVYTKNYTDYQKNELTSLQSILILGDLTDIYSIQVGNGAHSTLNTLITGVESPVACGGDLTRPEYAISGGDYTASSKLNAFNRKSSYLDTEITTGYQEWGFTSAKTNLSNSGLANDTTLYSGIIYVDSVLNSVLVTGRNAQTFQGVVQEINKSLSGAYAEFKTTGNGRIRVSSNSVGQNSAILISSGNIFSSLADHNAEAFASINGINSAESWKSNQTGSGVFEQAYIGQNSIPISYKISKLKYKNSPNIKNNPESIKVQWKYEEDEEWQTLSTEATVNTPKYWNEISLSDFTLSGIINVIINKYALVGSSGEIQTSFDGLSWEKQNSANNYSGTLSDITGTLTNFITVGSSGEIQTSSDGETWEKRSTDNDYVGDFYGVAYGSGVVIAGGSSGEIQKSVDNGSSWYHAALMSSADNTLNKIKYENEQFIIVGDNAKLYTSPSGTIWASKSFSNLYEGIYHGVTFINNQTFVLGDRGVIERYYGEI